MHPERSHPNGCRTSGGGWCARRAPAGLRAPARSAVLRACLLGGLFAAAAAAQETPGGPLDEVRKLVAFTDAHDEVIDAWIQERVEELKGKLDEDPVAAAGAFRRAFAELRALPDNTPAFTTHLAERAAVAIAAEFSRPEPLSAYAAWAMARVIHEAADLVTREALAAGLQHPVPVVRYHCARAYADLERQLTANASLARTVVARLREVGQTENSGVVLGAIYDALSLEDNALLPDATGAMAAVFDARVRRRASGEAPAIDRAEIQAWEYLYARRARLPQPEKIALVRGLAGFLTLDVNAYTTVEGPQQRVLRERIEVCEELLEALAGKGGDVRGRMKEGGDTADVNMKIELLKWVGSEAEPGVLNQAPWSVPLGGLPAAS